MKTGGFICSIAIVLLSATALAQQTANSSPAAVTDNGYQIAERGKDFAIYRRITVLTDKTGQVSNKTNEFTLLENNLHYSDNGAWKVSEDVIESFPGGAVARRGPDKTIFSPDLNAEAVFDTQTSDGLRLRGGVRAIQLTDLATGKSLVLATVKQSAPGELVPPNHVVFRSGFEGLDADVLYVWKHNSFSQNVILNEQPVLPVGMDPKTTVLEVVTEFVEALVPVLNEQVWKQDGGPDMVDHVTIGFGQMLVLRGHAFAVDGDPGVNVSGVKPADEQAVPVLKQWHKLDDGRTFLVELVGWQEIAPLLQDLPVAQRVDNTSGATRQIAQGRLWPQRSAPPKRQPTQVAALPYQPKGFVIDFETRGGSTTSMTFETGKTYYITNLFYIGAGDSVFQPGCVVKYTNHAGILMYGPISFPDTLQTPVFTSKDDDSFGEIIPGSSGNPTYAAEPALLVYYVDWAVEVKNARIRWARRGLQFDNGYVDSYGHIVRDSLFEKCQTGIYLNLPSGSVSLVNVKKCNVTTPIAGCCYWTGTMTDPIMYIEKNVGGLNSSDSFGVPPDTMGATGPNHFVELIISAPGLQGVAAYSKTTGNHNGNVSSTDDFFRTGIYPTGAMIDPRIVYDHLGGRWLACAIDNGSQQVILNVSINNSPVPLASNWRKYVVDVKRTGFNTDFVTLGVDVNGVYLSVFHFKKIPQLVTDGNTVVAMKKAELYQDNYLPNKLHVPISELDTLVIQPAVNFDNPPLNGWAWFVAKGPPQGQGTGYQPGQIYFRRMQWNGTVASWADSSWRIPSGTGPTRFFDFDSGMIYAPQLGGTQGIDLNRTGSRLMMSVIRSGYLWTCSHVGLDGSDGDYDGDETGTTVDRSGAQWAKLQLNTGTNALIFSATEKVFDSAASSPYYFYMPSLMVNSRGDMVIGFSGSKSTEYIGAFFTGRLNNGTWLDKPVLIQAGRAYFNRSEWGDYSSTSLDPSDDLALWSIQEYAHLAPFDWGTWIAKIRIFQ